ncbi:ammonia-forming cytochrome c nitrite reductase subunit c552 [Heliobacterium undosum]|uniref:nitrite reductase (cytochrome; ammonia-forming) n=1 Tax=Heliomicrobium undosum TaxID=121734 RepID=A0A845KXH4_9FIRM|nr:ammonia-forming cytochrome c nitrite reductase subunit c552 [Heliomicrobium undosum]MZP28272.1 ammonia-forming cytochrome c nitrite reductase subunit c552 [Heliomicrobium undosum]
MTRKKWVLAIWAVLLVAFAAVVVAGCGGKPASTTASAVNTGLAPDEMDLEKFAKLYPHHYDSFMKNAEMSSVGTKYGGNLEKDSHLEKYPYLKNLFGGYAFSLEYNEDRGHVYTMTDLATVKRVTSLPNGKKQVGSCLTCKSAEVPGMIAKMGETYYTTPVEEHLKNATHGMTCSNCHDPQTMKLRVVQPAFIDAMKRRGEDVTKATQQQLRDYVCAQCHVEYYFNPAKKGEVTFPWDKGFTPAAIETYYDEVAAKENNFKADWTQPATGAPLLKAQHPEFETFQGSIHQINGVSCADCHMPYVKQGGQKITSHWWTSPLKTMDQSCLVCHREPVDKLRDYVIQKQDLTFEMLNKAGASTEVAGKSINKAMQAGASDADLAEARKLLRSAQWYWDFVAAENSMGFHNTPLTMNTLAKSIDLAQKSTMAAAKAGNFHDIPEATPYSEFINERLNARGWPKDKGETKKPTNINWK